MSDLNFSEKELNLIKQYSVRQPLSRTIIFYLCVLAAPIGFAVYGALNKDPIAMFVAFLGLLVFVAWYISASIKNEKSMNGIFDRILKNELSK